MFRSDYIERQIKLVAAAIARALGLRRTGLLDEARDELQAALASTAGMDPVLLDLAEPAMIAAQLREPGRVAAIADLLAERAEVEDARGDSGTAARTRRRALELRLEALLQGAPYDERERDEIRALRARAGDLGPRYAAILDSVEPRRA